MIGPDLPDTPQSLKSVQHYLRIASMHDQRDPVVSYWCRLYALQTGLKLSTKTPKETNFLMKLMDWLERTKKEYRDNEAITNDVAAQAHLENWALKLFLNADENDRAGNFGKNVIQSFFTAGLLYDVLSVFGELSEEAMQNRKYAKWKAAYIHNCLKNNETPVPGPIHDANYSGELDRNMEGEDTEDIAATSARGHKEVPSNPDESVGNRDTESGDVTHGGTGRMGSVDDRPPGNKGGVALMQTEDGVQLSVEQIGKVQKFIKWAGSALNYDDVPTTVLNLQKALHLLTTGEELT